jgi:hypothetical protein
MIAALAGPLLRLHVGPGTLRAEAVERGSITWVGEASYGDLAELADVVARLAAEPPCACKRLVVLLERPPAQLRTLTGLPPVNVRHLATLVAQQSGRFFRKNGQPLVTDARWIGTQEPRVVRAAAVEEPLVEAIATGARAAGLWLETITTADDMTTLMLLPRSERDSRQRAARRRTLVLAIAAAAAWVACGTLFCGRLVWEQRAVARGLAALEKPLAAVLDARRELRDAEATVNAITAAERERGRSLTELAAVTRGLPDSSVLTSLAWSADGTGVLIGAARRATDVVARLDRLSTLPGVRLGGPVVRESIGGRDWERFTVLFGEEKGKREGS